MKKIMPVVTDFLKRADVLLLALSLISSIYGVVVISSATASYGTNTQVIVQLVALTLGIGMYILLTVIDIDIISDKWPLLLAFCVALLLLLVPFGEEGDTGNRGWLRFLGIGIQPSEVVKVVYIILMAKHISHLKEYRGLDSFVSVAQLALHFAFMFGLIIVVSKDLGSSLVFLFIFVVMLFAAGLKIYWFIIGLAGVAALTPFIWTYVLEDYQKQRILLPYDPTIDPEGFGIRWQSNQSKLALASGQFTGVGLGNGTQSQSDALVGKHTDFIFSVVGEELGMIGCLAVLLLLLLIVARCVYIGLRSGSTMGMLACYGVAATVLFQTFENVGMCIGITPVIGITLPFFSYGGSSMLSMFAAMGIVSGIKYKPKPQRFRRYE